MNFLKTLKAGDKVILNDSYEMFNSIVSKATKTTITINHHHQDHKFRIKDNTRIGFEFSKGDFISKPTPRLIKIANRPQVVATSMTILFNT